MIVLVLAAFLVFGSMLLRLMNDKSIQLLFNLIILLALSLTFLVIVLQLTQNTTEYNLIAVNPFALFFSIILTVGMFILNFVAIDSSEDYGDFAVLSNLALVGMYLVVSSTSLVTIFVGLELATLPAVFLILLSKRAIEAATKYFIMSSIAIALLSFAIVIQYGASNSFSFGSYSQSALVSFAAILFIVALGFESSVFPFNVLIPDIYQGSPGYVTALLGGLNKKVGLAALMQVMILLFIANKSAFMIVAGLAVLTMFYGNIVALMQKNLKRLFAYSSISQVGYILIGIAVATPSALAGSIFQIFAHIFLFIGSLAIISWLEGKNKTTIDDLIGLNNENRLAAFGLSLFMLSFIGLPFTTGFVGKFLIFISAVNGKMFWLAALGIINTAISVFYYAKLMMAMYTSKSDAKSIIMSQNISTAVVICIILTVLFGIYPQPVTNIATSAASYLLGH